MTTRIQDAFAAVTQQNRMAFMPFITAGDPDMATTAELIQTLADCKVDLIEIGFPYSDPIADGPVIQASYTRALENGLHIRDIFSTVSELDTDNLPPLVGMVSYSLIFRNGAASFIERARQAGFSGLIVPDLPGDEAEELAEMTRSAGIDLVQLVAPTTPPHRAERILKSASGFLYCISVSGTTGEREALPEELREQLTWLRSQTDLPLAVGFGISRADQLPMLRGKANGVIVGSAIVRKVEQLSNNAASREAVFQEIQKFATEMVEGCSQAN